jgi:uncharacterized protein YcgL (UPF0745 family)
VSSCQPLRTAATNSNIPNILSTVFDAFSMFLHPAIALAADLQRLFCPVKKQGLYYQVPKKTESAWKKIQTFPGSL